MKTGKGILKNTWLYIPFFLIAVIIAYHQVFDAGFISWDDSAYTFLNKDIYDWKPENIANWFSHFYIGNYHPFTILSYAIDYAIGKQDPTIYHTVNILLHTANTCLLFAFINKLQSNNNVSFFVALLFAIHPVQTESVSWIAERKNVLYGFFFLLSLWSYAGYVSDNSRKKYLLVVAAGIAAMLSKATAVSLPISLFAVDIWLKQPLNTKKVWLNKLPLILLAIPTGIIAVKAQDSSGFLNLHSETNPFSSFVYAGYAYTQYILHFLFPQKLSVLYPYPVTVGLIQYFFLLLSLLVIGMSYSAYKKGWHMLCGAIIFYTANIILLLQFIQFGNVLMADRYLYIASIGIILPAVYYLFKFMQNGILGVSICSVTCALCLYLTGIRNDIWLSEENFWGDIVLNFPNSSIAQSSLGGVYLNQGDYAKAMTHIDEAIKIDKNNYRAWYNKGVIYLRKREVKDALYSLNKAILIDENPKALFTRAILYEEMHMYQNCYNDIEKVLLKEPENARAFFIKANCLEQQNDLPAALVNYNQAIKYDSNDALFYLRRGIVETELGQGMPAIKDLNKVIEKNQKNAEALYWRGLAKYRAGIGPCDDLQQALQYGFRQATEMIGKICNTR